MKILAMVRAEVARLTSTLMSRIALVALLLVPVLYGGLYLWANQDPYAGLDRVPVALVMTDAGADVEGAPHNYGDEVATQLVDDGSFQWHRVSASTAKAGVADSTYDFSVTIPADFSTAIVSTAGDAPRQATITLSTNDTTSYLASTIGNQAAKTLREAIVQKVNEQAASGFLIGLSDVRSNLVTATDGAAQMTDGADSAGRGAAQLADGAAQLAAGAHSFTAGLDELADGTGRVSTGADDLAGATEAVAAGTAKVSDGAITLAEGTERVASGTEEVSQGAGTISSGLTRLTAAQYAAEQAGSATSDSLSTARADIRSQLEQDGLMTSEIDSVVARLDEPTASLAATGTLLQGLGVQSDRLQKAGASLSAGATQAASGAALTQAGAVTLRNGATQTAAGASQTSEGAQALRVGSAAAHTGAVQAAEGAGDAESGAVSLEAGAQTLREGLGELKSGAADLRDGLQTGVDQIPESDSGLRGLQGATIADPVDLNTAAVTSAGTYGAGLAPFFVSLAGWIGIYALFLIVKPVSRRAITALHSPIKITLAGWLTPGLLGMVQMAALFAIVAGVLHFTVHNPVGTYAMMGLAALTFAAIILALNVWLGSVGQFIGLVLMVVQLVTAGGTFPWQTLPAPLDWLHHVVPMSYAVDGIRQLMYGGNPTTAWADAGVLLLWLAGALVLTVIGVTRMTHFRTLRDLRPSLIG
ncbi:membrane protein [Cryobacterium roopkundense]|uniref:Membrane protein n=1 Tax=Cryobacterium roopkundense TaxID=1001240 RepID=A0A099JCG8_9MICO|nr:YhgE/Pip domain-containing protein [Cryobacterium roopkundense]KGJ75976.1 membrane protein [Cryobacterium roopkundense]MBB5641326.1 putative membrane protein [Cryobacterium roopkundense]